MKKILVAVIMVLTLGVSTSASAIAGTGASTEFYKKKVAKDYTYYHIKKMYLKEKPTKAEIKKDNAKATKVNKVLKALTQERQALDNKAYYNNKEIFPARIKSDYKHKTTTSIMANSKTKFTIRYRFYQSVSDRQADGWGNYKFQYQDVTVAKKTGKISYGKWHTVKNK